jgi:uncharacterized 2Fe-2S/4Fe-4S cluster protein (DUF4445 family)
MKRYTVTVSPGGERASFPEGTLLVDALADMGHMAPTPCGGRGVCGKCAVRAEGGLSPLSLKESDALPGQDGWRLACQASLTGDTVVMSGQRAAAGHSYPSPDPSSRLGLAVDIGTTSVQISLVPLDRGEPIPIDSFINPQSRYGHDVISRIAAARDGRVASDMTGRIRAAIRGSLDRAVEALSLDRDRFERIVIAGNTTMLYLFFGLDVQPLGRHPYRAERRDLEGGSPVELGLGGLARAGVRALPILSAFVGGDAVGGFAERRARGFGEGVFFIDLGTNGEIMVSNGRGEVHAASCAMGPALEGMNISHGMTAADGAITRVMAEGDRLSYSMIGEGGPAGISGTALVDLAALLLDRGGMSRRGLLAGSGTPLPAPAEITDGPGGRSVKLWGRIALSQADVRNLQLAKGASLAASRLLLDAAGCSPGDIRHVIIAGALGRNLDPASFKKIGFIPDFPSAEVQVAGNTSLAAAERACRDDGFILHARDLRDRMNEVPLAAREDFRREFVSCLDFPGSHN